MLANISSPGIFFPPDGIDCTPSTVHHMVALEMDDSELSIQATLSVKIDSSEKKLYFLSF